MNNDRQPGRILALDIGAVRTGVALSDELGLTARPLETVPTASLADRLHGLFVEHGISLALVGRPRSLDGSLGSQVLATEAVVAALREQFDVPFQYEDETGTTAEAQARGGDDGHPDDALAACVMLQGYLDEQARQ